MRVFHQLPEDLTLRLHPERAVLVVLDVQLELVRRAVLAAGHLDHRPPTCRTCFADMLVHHIDTLREALARYVDAVDEEDHAPDDIF